MMPSPASIVVAAIGCASLPTLATARYRGPSSADRKIALVSALEQVLGVTSDAVHHRLQVETRRDVATHLGQRRALPSAPADLVEQVGVVERHARHAGQRLEEADVAVRERVLALVVGDG